MRIHHVQLGCPPGGEAEARRFWVDGIGLTEIAKPAVLAARGGAWFRGEDGVEVHIGVESDFRRAAKAHPALLLAGADQLASLADRLAGLGFAVDRTEAHTFPGYLRVHVRDGHGNRIELLAEPA